MIKEYVLLSWFGLKDLNLAESGAGNNFKEEEESLHPWVKVDQAARPLALKRLSIL